ncbi:MAG TPA: MgtC/SapB family protein [Candidatus Humimicrobiaceae bacterium]
MEFTEKLLSEIRFDSTVVILDILIPCILSLIFGGIIGFQREKADRPAGLRTHALVCLGSTVFTLISYLGFSSGGTADPTRIAAGIVTGIGFIGAGVIFRQGSLIRGVTTAASIWTVASIGMALGVKLYYLAILVTILGFLTLSILKYFEDRIIRLPDYSLKIITAESFDDLDKITGPIEKMSVNIKSKKYELDRETNKKIFIINLHSKDPEFSTKIIKELSKFKEIEEITIN